MGIVSEEDYMFLCDVVLNIDHNITFNNLEALKEHYKHLINSSRRLENIGTLRDLVKVLEKRGCISPKNITILYEIAAKFNQSHLLEVFHNRMNFEPQNNAMQSVNQISYTPQRVLPVPSSTIKGKVHCLICRELGKGWVNFARGLNIQESEIDQLKMKYSRDEDRKTCINEILEYHERNVHPRVWKTQLLEALEKARRNDLKNSVQNIFDTYS